MDLALERAKQKAEKFALKSGRKAGDIIDITEQASGLNRSYSPSSNYLVLSYAREEIIGQGQASMSAPISTGQMEINAAVNVVYELD